jgi:hypothetical protein
VLYAHTLFTGEREIKRGSGRKRKGERERGRERERCRICPELLFLFLKGMMGALVPYELSSLKYD